MPGVSSIKIGAFDIFSIAVCNCCHSCASNCPVRNLLLPTSDSIETRRCTNCRFDISRENKATPFPNSIAAFRAKESVNAVFPMDGRAATIIKSEGCQPEVKRSKSVKPVGTPVKPSFFCDNNSICFNNFPASVFIPSKLRDKLVSVIEKRLCSALSRRSKTSVESS